MDKSGEGQLDSKPVQDQDNDIRYSRARMFDRADEQLAEHRRKRELAAMEKSAKWAKYSMIIAALALAVAVWSLVRD